MRGVQAGVGSWKLLVWNTERRCRLVWTPDSQPLLDPTAAPSVSQSRFCLRVEGNFSHFREMCQYLIKVKSLLHLKQMSAVAPSGCRCCCAVSHVSHVTTWPRDPSPGWTDLRPETRHLVLQLPHPVSLRHGGRQVVLGAELLVLKIHQFYGTFKGF